jgi:glycosyltransferase involved in cell wall biosynthesis
VGLKQATGTYVKFLDADDELYETAVEAQVRQMEELSAGSSRQIVFGDAKFVDESGETVRESDYRRSKKNENDVEYILKVNPQTSLPIHRRSWLLEVDGFDESLPRAQEYDLHVRLSLKGVSFRYEKELVSRVKVHDGEDRITNKDHFQENPEALLSRIRKRRKMIEESGLLNERIRQYLAHDAWRGGRMALRKGLDDIASTYFGVARSLHHDPLRGWAPAYQWCTHLFGPRIAERIGTCMRTVKATLK